MEETHDQTGKHDTVEIVRKNLSRKEYYTLFHEKISLQGGMCFVMANLNKPKSGRLLSLTTV